MRRNVLLQIILGQRSDIFFWSQNSTSQSSSLKGGRMQVVHDKFFVLLVDFRHFSENDIALSVNGTWVQFGVKKNVGEDLYSLTNVILEHLGKVDSLFARCVGVPEVDQNCADVRNSGI